MEAYYSNGRSVIAKFLSSSLSYSSTRSCPDRKCVLIWMDSFRATGMSPKKRKDLRRQLEYLKLWNELVCQFRPVRENDPTVLTRSPRKEF
ncbi:hypothetical protein TNCV_622161 [Trichonephila clavipes]|nr:hypothetical protein TNCV_622161 [Trichonephila clavipes]